MKYDIVIMADDKVLRVVENVEFLVAVAILLGFKRKGHKQISFTITTSQDA